MPAKLHPSAKLVLDFAPLAVFFLAYKFGEPLLRVPSLSFFTDVILLATAALIVMTLVSLAVTYAVERSVALAPLISGVLVTLLGGMSVIFRNEQFIKMKPTAVNIIFAVVLLGGVYLYRRGLLKYILDVAFKLTEEGWCVLSRRWGFFFLFLAGLNEVIWRNFTTEFWVNFKVFGMLTLTIAFAISQYRLVERYKAE